MDGCGSVKALDNVVVKSYTGHSDDVSCCSFSSDWKLLVTGADDFTLRLWNITNTNVIHILRGHKQQVKCVSFSHDNKKIASGGYDRIILIWDITTGKCMNKLECHTSSVECVCFSNNGGLLCSGSWDYSAALWDLNSGVLLTVLKHHTSVVQCCAFSLHGNMLATGSWDYTIHVFDVVQCTEKASNNIKHLNTNNLKPNSKTKLPSDEQNSKFVMSLNHGILQNMRRLEFHESNIKCVTFSCDDLIASASWDCTVCIWNASSGVCLYVLRGHDGFVQTCTFSADGLYLASAADDETIRVWSVKDGVLMKTLEAYAEEIHQLSFTQSGTLLSSGPQKISLCLY